ncbi:FAD-dependent oxidoreductase [Bryobacter aggregatus]|uniref:FAD-dependent oxidoreductase n=1 Tax=Bryobacter aggregatus TaxID=360054 RepID=UPI000A45285E|nr:FAD-dependent oxidoreductase [Bryobacter aggregatus]
MMRRRDLLTSYSLVVLADQLPAAQQRPPFDRIAPPGKDAKDAGSVQEPHLSLVSLDCDVLVAGGGVAGVCAAISAARHGAKVVLIQDRSRLGGNSSSEVKMHIVGADSHRGRPGWRESGLIEELRLEDAVNNPQRCWEMWDFILYDKVVSEPNITLLLETILYKAKVQGDKLTEVYARCDKSEQIYRITAKYFVDSTGDSRLALESGAAFRTGREQRSEYNESLAPEKADQETLGSSILFTSRLHNKPMPFKAPAWARKVTPETLRFRKVDNWEYGYWWIEWGGNKDIIRDNELIRYELLSIVMGVWDYIKNSGNHTNSANYAFDWIGMMPGKRGSRRLTGDHVLTQHDLMSGSFPDAIAMGGWPMDDHPPGGFDRADLPPNTNLRTPEVYPIPLRSCYSKNIANLFMAGRNISATHAAFTSTRVMATCATIGQAVGTAAALCVEKSKLPRQVVADQNLIQTLQQRLLRDDQTIKGKPGELFCNEDPSDLARSATWSSSGDLGEAVSKLVIDGITRDIPKGPAHHWAGPMSAEGAWIECKFEQPRTLREVQLTFDSGFQRQLFLTANDAFARDTPRMPQPETVKDYSVLVRKKGTSGWETVATVKGNYQRLNRVKFQPVEAEAVRVHVTATNGVEEARIFEIRCYA